MELNETYRLGDKVLNIHLLQVIPGKETELFKQLTNICDPETIFKGFGRYDLIVIDENDDFSLIKKLRENFLQFVIDRNTVCGYKWVPQGKKEAHIPKNKEIVGICCLRFDWDRITKSKLATEYEISESLYSKQGSTVIFGGLGLEELICIISCNDFDQLNSEVVKIKKKIDTLKIPLLDMSTIPCVSFSRINADKLNSDKQVQALILASLAGGASKEIIDELNSLGGEDVSELFGFHDVSARFNVSLRELVRLLLKLRTEKTRFSIYSTSTIIRHLSGGYSDYSNIGWAEVLPNPSITKFIADNPERLDDFGYYYNIFLALSTDPFAKYLIKDLTVLFDELRKIYEIAKATYPDSKEDYHDLMEIYDTVIDSLRLIFQQRCSGIQIPNLLGLKNLNLESYGGSLKILHAHEALVEYLLQLLGIKWTGRSVFGYSHKFYWAYGGIINMPTKTEMHPEEWWGSCHEVGHEAFNRLNLYYPKIYSDMNQQRKNNKKKWEELYQEDSFELIWEAFADSFDFHFGFFSDWDFYCKIVWTYLAKNFELTADYLVRMLLVYFVFGPGTTKNPESQKEILKILKDLIEKAQSVNPSVEFTHDNKKEVIFKYLLLLEEFSLAKPVFPKQAKIKFDPKQINASLAKGFAIRVQPNVLVRSLIEDESSKTLRHRLAAILSLYDWSK